MRQAGFYVVFSDGKAQMIRHREILWPSQMFQLDYFMKRLKETPEGESRYREVFRFYARRIRQASKDQRFLNGREPVSLQLRSLRGDLKNEGRRVRFNIRRFKILDEEPIPHDL